MQSITAITMTWLLPTPCEYLKAHYADLVNSIESRKELSKEDEASLKGAIAEFKKNGAI